MNACPNALEVLETVNADQRISRAHVAPGDVFEPD